MVMMKSGWNALHEETHPKMRNFNKHHIYQFLRGLADFHSSIFAIIEIFFAALISNFQYLHHLNNNTRMKLFDEHRNELYKNQINNLHWK